MLPKHNPGQRRRTNLGLRSFPVLNKQWPIYILEPNTGLNELNWEWCELVKTINVVGRLCTPNRPFLVDQFVFYHSDDPIHLPSPR